MSEPAATPVVQYAQPTPPPPAPARDVVGKHTVHGTIRVFLAEALILPTGLVTAAFLTRKLGTNDYGLFTLASMLVAWMEWTIASVFARAVIKFTAEADDWRPVGTTVIRQHLYISCAAAVALIALAGPVCAALGAPTMVPFLRLLALDIPIFSLGQAHRNILIGIGGFGRRAVGGAARWVARLILIVALVELGLSINGAVLGSIGASLVELVICRIFAPAPLFGSATFPASLVYNFAVPLFLASLSLRLFEKLDLMLLKSLGGTLADAGVYGAAQNLSIIPGILALSFSPLLLSTLTRVMCGGDVAHATDMARDSIRGAMLLVPFAGIVAGAAHEIVVLIFGREFAGAAQPLAWLMFAGLGMLMISVTTAVMVAGNKPGWTFAVSGPMVPLALAGHLLLIPRFHARGAAAVTAGVACATALVSIAVVYRLWRTSPRLATWIRAILVTVGAYLMSAAWPAPGVWVVLKLAVCSIAVPVALLALGEFDARELNMAKSAIHAVLPRRRVRAVAEGGAT